MATFVRVFGALMLLKALDLLPRTLMVAEGPWGTALAVGIVGVWTASSVRWIAGRDERLDAALMVLCVAMLHLWDTSLHNQHLAVIGWVAAILWLFRDDDERFLLLRVQLTVIYGFAALTKMNGSFLAGEALSHYFTNRPIGTVFPVAEWPRDVMVALSLLTILAEGWLAVGLWFRKTRLLTTCFGVVFHMLVVVVISAGVLHALRLWIFNGLMVLFYLAFWQPGRDPSRPAPPYASFSTQTVA